MCLAGGGGIFTGSETAFDSCLADGGGIATCGEAALDSLRGSKLNGLMSGRFTLSLEKEAPRTPQGLSAMSSSSSGLTQAFPFRILSSL